MKLFQNHKFRGGDDYFSASEGENDNVQILQNQDNNVEGIPETTQDKINHEFEDPNV